MDFRFLDDNKTFSISSKLNIFPLSRISSSPIVEDEIAILSSFKQPLMTKNLSDLLKNRKQGKICIVISDIVNNSSIRVVFSKLVLIFDNLGIPEEDIQILIANGDREKNSSKEIKDLIGKQAVYRFDIVNHDANDQTMNDYIGDSKNNIPIYLNSQYIKSNFRIILNLVQPNFLFGYTSANFW